MVDHRDAVVTGNPRGYRHGRFTCRGPDEGTGRMKAAVRWAAARWAAARWAAAALACAGLIAGLAGCSGSPTRVSPQQAAARFLASYSMPDGRVVRLDQGHDTVSEGQAYGMLLAQMAGDNAQFRRIWQWTRDHLQLPDGLFAWNTDAAGQVVSLEPASDADLLIAWALLRYRGPAAATLHQDGRRVAAGILANEVITGPGGMRVLTAGPWANGFPATINPSYWSLPAFRGLEQLTGSEEWHRLAVSAVRLTGELTQGGRVLPPDWALLSADGAVRPEPAPDGTEPEVQYGPGAQRTVVWFAASCDPLARSLAAHWWRLLRPGHRSLLLALRLGGGMVNPSHAALPLVASAAAAKSAGDRAIVTRLLQRAQAQQRRWPTYYGGAWVALGPALLTTGGVLSTC
jgi:endoglucanase